MNRIVSLGLTATIALCASVLRSQDSLQPPLPARAPAVPRALVSPVPSLIPLPPGPPGEGTT